MKTRATWRPVQRMAVATLAVTLFSVTFWMFRSSTPVVKAQCVGLGCPIPNITSRENTMFEQGETPYEKKWDPKQGLGVVYTQETCINCHGAPIAGGGGNNLNKIDTIFATIDSTGQFDPMDGSDTNGSGDEGGILLQTQSIGQLVPQCKMKGEVVPSTPTFPVAATLIDKRLAPPNFGMGLIDSIPSSSIQTMATNENAVGSQWQNLGIHGVVNPVTDEFGNTSQVGKFGYKAEAASLIQFVGLALTNEIAITNPMYAIDPTDNGVPANSGCIPKGLAQPNDNGTQTIAVFHYLLYLAPSAPQACTGSCLTGQMLFDVPANGGVGCALCHVMPSVGYTTGPKVQVPEFWVKGETSLCGSAGSDCFFSKALSSQQVGLYSDLLLHDMGIGTLQNHLGDGFCDPQPAAHCPFGSATGSQFRTTPLWGLSVKLSNKYPLLHDGRTTDITSAIEDHALSTDSEAWQVVQNFNALSPAEQIDLLNFLLTL